MYFIITLVVDEFWPLDLFLEVIACSYKEFCLSFPSSLILWRELCYTYLSTTPCYKISISLFSLNSSKIEVEKWVWKSNSLLWDTTGFSLCATSGTHLNNAVFPFARTGPTTYYLFTIGGAPLAPPVFLMKGVVLDLWRKKKRFREASRRWPSWSLIPKNQERWNLRSPILGMIPPPLSWNPQPTLSFKDFK